MLLSTAFIPPVEYFAVLARYSSVYIEACENYQKQSYRNRCYFCGARGREPITVPVVHGNGTFSLPIREIRVDWSTPWEVRAERAIESAYGNSPFFEYYRDPFFAIIDSRPERLWDLNMQLIRFFCSKTGIGTELLPTDVYVPHSGLACPEEDLREAIHPKRVSDYRAKEYFQVFSRKYGFIPNLSVMDLLFNEGPESVCILK